ncbi:CYTH domain-containing protein [Bacillus sp. AK031]
MPQELEIEFKNLLTLPEFNTIKNRLSIAEEDFTLQKNHYFDTSSNDLKKLKCALRIREKNDKYELTLKQPAEDGLLETNQVVTSEDTTSMLTEGSLPAGEVKAALDSLGVSSVKFNHFGTLSTNRAETHYKGGLMVLDYSFYLNNEDYELEYEVKDKQSGQEIFLGFLKDMNIPFRPAENKIKRFLQAANAN